MEILGLDDDHELDGQVIAEGIASTVIKSDDGKAIKCATTVKKFTPEPHDILKECKVVSSLNHINIIAHIATFHDDEQNLQNLHMPYIPYSLTDLIESPFFSPHKCPSLPPEIYGSWWSDAVFVTLTRSIVWQILSAVAYLHSRSIAHRDLKPSNVLLTRDCCVKLIDFGVSYPSPSIDLGDVLWPEDESHKYFEVSTGSYRAPELLFGTRTYDPYAVDLWSLGALFSEFFTAMYFTTSDRDFEEDETCPYIDPDDDNSIPFLGPEDLLSDPTYRSMGHRKTLFNGTRGEIGLVWSIFRIRGTPTDKTWPDFTSLPDANRLEFMIVPSVPLRSLLPNLPNQNQEALLDLLDKLLAYPPQDRISPHDALRHLWIEDENREREIIVPNGYPFSEEMSSQNIKSEDLTVRLMSMLGRSIDD